MANYQDYNNTRNAMNGMIKDKQDMIDVLESEIFHLRKSLRILDTEFKEKLEAKELPEEFK